MAECVFRDLVDRAGVAADWTVDSAGTGSWHVGDPPDPRTVAVLERHGVPVIGRGRQVKAGDFTAFDHLLVMDRRNLEDLGGFRPRQATAEVGLLATWDEQGPDEIGDPYYGGPEGFEQVFEQVVRSCQGFLAAHS